MTLVVQKTHMRAKALARRASIEAAMRSAFAIRLAAEGLRLVHAMAKAPAPIVSVYIPIRDEADTGPLLQALSDAGFATALPVTLGRDKPLRFHLWRPGDPVAPGHWNIPEPLPGAPQADPDVLFVPLAAFDRRGHRLGYGAGFYDNALARLRAQKSIVAIGVAFGAQEVDPVPCEPHDQRLDAVVTEDDVLLFGPD